MIHSGPFAVTARPCASTWDASPISSTARLKAHRLPRTPERPGPGGTPGCAEASIDTRTPEELASLIEPFNAGPLAIEPMRSNGFHAKARAWRMPHVSLFQVKMRQGWVFSPPHPTVSLSIPLTGHIDAPGRTEQTTVGPGLCLVRDETDALDCEVPGCVVLVGSIDAQLLCETAGTLAGADPPERFQAEPMLSLTSPMGVCLWRQLTSLWRAVRSDEPWLQSPAAVAEEGFALAAALIDATAGSCPPCVASCGRTPLRRAEEFILAHVGDPISRADLCAISGVCERSLSRAFRRHHGVGPMTFLRQRRLDAAQRLLLAADRADCSVTDIAMDCGLHHLGRFSVDYRRAFGEAPSETLRR